MVSGSHWQRVRRSLWLVGLFWRASSVFKIGDLGVISGFARDDLATAGRLENVNFDVPRRLPEKSLDAFLKKV